ncbi:MAG: GGDEF domain-containing protein [Planctomycetota bacterium]
MRPLRMEQSGKSGWLTWIERASPAAVTAMMVGVVTAVALADVCSTADVNFTLAYLLPIALAAWRLGIAGVVITVFVCAITWLGVHVTSRELAMPPAIDALNLVMELGVFLAFGLALVSLRRHLDEERRLARTDSLTGVANRRSFRHECAREIERCRRFGQPFSLAYIDVDGFKSINDRLGHQSGDELLQAVAHTLASGVRRVDVVARLGGDEFALLLPGTDGVGAAVLMAKLRSVLDDGLRRTFGVGCSIGCLTVLSQSPDVDELIARADRLMYEVKQGGRGQLRHQTLPQGVEVDVAGRSPRRRAD